MTLTLFETRRQRDRIIVGSSYLTPREYQIVSLYIDGCKFADMPNQLGCTDKTVQRHMQVAKERIGALTIHQLIAMVAAADALRVRQ
jgi:DNA-binding CsgD family transcriptional regulator